MRAAIAALALLLLLPQPAAAASFTSGVISGIRAVHGPIRLDPELMANARSRAGAFDEHAGAGYISRRWSTWGEVLGRYSSSPQALVAGWMASAPHHAVLMGRRDAMGVACVHDAKYPDLWDCAAVFGRLRARTVATASHAAVARPRPVPRHHRRHHHPRAAYPWRLYRV